MSGDMAMVRLATVRISADKQARWTLETRAKDRPLSSELSGHGIADNSEQPSHSLVAPKVNPRADVSRSLM